jgi:hypothetical protein
MTEDGIREGFYKTLSNLGVLPGLEMTLQSSIKVLLFEFLLYRIFFVFFCTGVGAKAASK